MDEEKTEDAVDEIAALFWEQTATRFKSYLHGVI
jgi:hypothetical protein